MHVEQLFIESLVDVDQKLRRNPSEYELLKIAGLLRLILMNEAILDDAASAAPSIAVKFRVVKPGPPPIPPEWQKYIDSEWDKFLAANPDVKRVDIAFGIRGDLLTGEASQPDDVVLALGRKDFLSHEIITYNDTDYTVEYALRVAANSLGGIHWGPNRTARAKELRQHTEGSEMFRRPLAAGMIFGIARCTLRACQPLADELTEVGLYSPCG